jgi:hypothetical protein
VTFATEALANCLEHVFAQKPNMSEVDWRVWKRFIEGAIRRAPVVRSRVESYSPWYSLELVEMVAELSRFQATSKPNRA